MNDLEFSNSEVRSVARKLGLPEAAFEDSERNKVIHHWTNADIVACPGSGKTTVLLAKLLLLLGRMPFEDGKGICVLTHTNGAINIIKDKLGQRAEIFFKHPNFFGTIQAFVDRFLAIPAYKNLQKREVKAIDTNLCKNKCEIVKWWKFKNNVYNAEFVKNKNAILSYLMANKDLLGSLTLCFDKNNQPYLSKTTNGTKIGITHRVAKYNGNKYEQVIYDYLFDVKKTIYDYLGIITYDEAFSLANNYINLFPQLSKFMSSRFQHLFIDEMQDTQKYQLEIIDKIFNHKVVKQFYGDPDQAIFNGISGGTSAWKMDINKLEITDSKRFGQSISTCIFPFRKEISKVKGTAKGSFKPYIIIYEKEASALKQFAKLITQTHKLDQIEECKKYEDKPLFPFNAVGFVGKDKENNLTIRNYFKDFSKETTTRKSDFSNLVSYFQKRPGDEIRDNGTRIYFQLFVNALIFILDRSNCKNLVTDRHFTKTSLMKHLKEVDENKENTWIMFQENCAKWIKNLHYNKKNPDQLKTEFIEYFVQNLKNNFPDFKDGSLNQKAITDNEVDIEEIDKIKNAGNIAEIDGIEIKVGTVHSIKGETHLATLFLETYYQGRKGKNGCESECFKEQFCGKKYNNKTRQTQFKTAYVALSRPSHLLCVALDKSRAKCSNCSDEDRNQCNWKIIYADDAT